MLLLLLLRTWAWRNMARRLDEDCRAFLSIPLSMDLCADSLRTDNHHGPRSSTPPSPSSAVTRTVGGRGQGLGGRVTWPPSTPWSWCRGAYGNVPASLSARRADACGPEIRRKKHQQRQPLCAHGVSVKGSHFQKLLAAQVQQKEMFPRRGRTCEGRRLWGVTGPVAAGVGGG